MVEKLLGTIFGHVLKHIANQACVGYNGFKFGVELFFCVHVSSKNMCL